MTEGYDLTIHGRKRVTGTLNLRWHSDFDEAIQALTIMRDLVEEPEMPPQSAALVRGGADALSALTSA